MLFSEVKSPIFQAELTYQRQHLRGLFPDWLRKLWAGAVMLGVISALLLVIVEFASAVTGYDVPYMLYELGFSPIVIIHVLPVVVLLPVTFLLHFAAILQTLVLASNMISRERDARMWGHLVLSPVSASHIVRMKFGATVWHMLPKYVVLSILRTGVVVYLGLEIERDKYFYYSPALTTFVSQIEPLYFLPDQSSIILAAMLMVIFTLLNLGFTTALGSVVSSMKCKRCAFASIILRQGTLLAVGMLLLLSRLPFSLSSATVLGSVGLTLLDNGTGLAAAVASASPMKIFAPFGFDVLVYYFVPIVGVVVPLLYILVTIIALGIARRRIISDGALA